LILDQIVLDYVLGIPKSLLTLGVIYIMVFLLIFPLGFKEFCLVYRYTLVFPTGFSKASRHFLMNKQRCLHKIKLIKGGVKIN
jgi:hypothetical protein